MSFIRSLAFILFLPFIIFVNGSIHDIPNIDLTQDVLKRLDELEQRERQQRAELDAVRSENTELRKTIVNLAEDIERLKERDSLLTDKIKVLEDRDRTVAAELLKHGKNKICFIKDMRKNSPKPNEKKLDEHKNSIPETNSVKPSEIREKSPNRGHSRIRQLDQEPPIAFYATRGPHAEHLGQHQTIIFDTVVTNIGGGYHNYTGVFMAPVSGVYVFSTTILTYSEDAGFEITVNGHVYASLFGHHTDRYETLSQTTIFSLNKGDDVAIQNRDSDKFVNGDHYSTFSGFLLASTERDVVIG